MNTFSRMLYEVLDIGGGKKVEIKLKNPYVCVVLPDGQELHKRGVFSTDIETCLEDMGEQFFKQTVKQEEGSNMKRAGVSDETYTQIGKALIAALDAQSETGTAGIEVWVREDGTGRRGISEVVAARTSSPDIPGNCDLPDGRPFHVLDALERFTREKADSKEQIFIDEKTGKKYKVVEVID